MGLWTSLVVLSVVAVSALSLPRPDEYDIPGVGNNRRSQYYVLHDDGSHKYGYDTGDDAFESQKTDSSGHVAGQYGYRDPDGQDIRVQYTSGHGGFVAQGAHIPQVHPDVTAAFAAARAQKPFVDPLAGSGGDRSYNFDFAGEEHTRSEVSDSDGTVRGSYSYIDEFGNTKTYTYRAGKGIGFVIEGDDLPQPVQPLPTHTSTTQFGSPTTRAQSSSSFHSKQQGTRTASTQRASHTVSKVSKPAQTYFAPPTQQTAPTRPSSASRTTSRTQQTSFRAPAVPASPVNARPTVKQASTKLPGSTRVFEAANTRASQSPSGSYEFAYETSSHSRQESGDDDNNVRGKFSFVSDDDGVDRSVSYEAGSATGFIAEGVHLPIGPIVPGAPTGQVTGRIVPVVQVPFIDPLADGDLDASYTFGFDSDTYSRSETADEDGNVVGTYSILGDDNILRTYRFRAGKGIGFETEEISAVPGRRSSGGVALSATSQQSSSPSVSHGSVAQSYSTDASRRTSSGSSAQFHGSSTVKSKPAAQFSSTTNIRAQPVTQVRSGQTSRQHTSTQVRSGTQNEVFPGFSLRQYDPSEGRGKYGYVLKFDD